MKRRYYRWMGKLKQWHFNFLMWRYPLLRKLFEITDKYYLAGVYSINEVLKRNIKFAKIRGCEARHAEKYRQENCKLRILLLSNGITKEHLETSDWSETVLGINTLSALIPDDLGDTIIKQIAESNLVQAKSEGKCVWSVNAPTQIKMFVCDKLFYGGQGWRGNRR